MIAFKQLRNIGLCALFALSLSAFPSIAAAQGGDGKEHHSTVPDGDGWLQTDTHKDGSKTETKMDKDLHKTKETEYDDKGKVTKESDWEWNGKEKKDVKRKERHHAHDDILESEDEYDENGVLVKQTVWFDGYVIVDTYKAGKRIKREKTKNGVTKTQRADKDGNLVANNLAAPPASPVITPGATMNGVVVGVPDQFAAGESIAFRVVKLTGEVVTNELAQLSNSKGETIWTGTDASGNVSAKIPNGWRDLHVEVLGAAAIAYAATHSGSAAPSLKNPPKFIQPGNLMTLRGDGFAPNLAGNTVAIGDKTGIVMGASPNGLSVFVPPTVPPGPTQIQVTSGSQSTAPVPCAAVTLAFDPGPSTLMPGQRVTRTLRVLGTEEKMPIQITDPQGDAATAVNPGLRTSSGGKNNTVEVTMTGVRQGSFSLFADFNWKKPALRNSGDTDYEKDLANAEAARRDQAGWKDSAAAESDENVAAAKRMAAGQAGMAAEDWDAAAEARKAGDDKKAAALEAAAKAREESAKAYGSDRNPGRGAAAAKDAKAQEDKAKSGG